MADGSRMIHGGTWSFHTPTRIMFGVGASENLGVEAKNFGGSKALVVTDSNIARLSLLENMVDRLGENGFQVDVFKDVIPEPSLQVARSVTEYARRGGYDLFVGIGGGSSMDLAKIASVLVNNSGDAADYAGVNLISNPGKSLILIPTTSGSGSEVTPTSIVALERKAAIMSPHLYADLAIVDPLNTMSMPPRVTATVGVDALTHTIETYVSNKSTELTKALSMRALKLIARSLKKAYVNGKDLDSRSDMSLGCMITGIAAANAGACLGHALSYSFASQYKCAHGVSTGITLPYTLLYNLRELGEQVLEVASALNVSTSENIPKVGLSVAGKLALMVKEVGLPTSLRELKIDKRVLPKLADDTMKTQRLLANNPRPVTRESVLVLLDKMWEGSLAL